MPDVRLDRSRIPAVLLELDRPGALGTLVAATAALFAAGLDPHVFGPNLPNVQSVLRERPSLEALFVATTIATAAFYLVGGALGDLSERRRLLLVGLAVLLVVDLVSAVVQDGFLFALGRVTAAAAVGLTVPVALAIVAMAYDGVPRATAIGVAYAGYGAATAISPAVLTTLEPVVGRAPSFLLPVLAGALALWLVRRRIVSDREEIRVTRREVGGHALWAFGLLALTAGAVGLGSGPGDLVRAVLFVVGLATLGAFALVRRRGGDDAGHARVELRPVAVALGAGVVIAFSQSAALLQAPLFFQVVTHYGPVLATLAIAPFAIALVVAGPAAGILLGRVRPRVLIAGGLLFVGVGDIAFALASPSTSYLYFILPFIAIGAGFVVGTTIRTAVIFASVPRRLPATAAALNQTSILVGTQLGILTATTVAAQVAGDTFRASLAGRAPADVAAAMDGFGSFLAAVGTSQFRDVLGSFEGGVAVDYAAAYAAGVSASMALVGIVALAGAVVTWLALGSGGPLTSVYDHRDERGGAPSGRSEAV